MVEEIIINTSSFLIKAIIFVLVFAVIVSIIAAAGNTGSRKIFKKHARFNITPLNKQLKEFKNKALNVMLSKKQLKMRRKQQKIDEKAEKKSDTQPKKRLYVIDFKGDIKASNVNYLKKEITLITSLAKPGDEVLIRIESPGGSVTGYGLAASEIIRLRNANISITAAVDQVAASGGYLAACAASKIIAAPFAILGSIGVVAMVPNFYELLKKKNIDFEVYTAGKYKRNITMFGKNTQEDVKQFKSDLKRIHELFKKFVSENRPEIKISEVANGNWWQASDALKLKLIDQILTSEDYLMSKINDFDIFEIKYDERQPVYVQAATGMSYILKKLLNDVPKPSTAYEKLI